jgi:ParB family chromosome partitioning protein
LRVFLSALCNLDPYTITEDVVEHFAEENDDHQQTPEEILAAALSRTPDAKLTSFALRLALTGYVTIPRESELDILAEAEAAFIPPQPTAKKKPKMATTPIKGTSKKTATKKKVAA